VAAEGHVYELRKGDVVRTMGGTVGARQYKRYRMDDKVVDIWRLPKARTRLHVQFERCGVLVMRAEYPVKYEREEA
jgi:hypothetical protein